MNSISGKFRQIYRQFDQIRLEDTDKGFVLGPQNPETSIEIEGGDDSWTMRTQESHAHFEDLDDCFKLVADLLLSKSRTGIEYRVDKHSQSWIEVGITANEFEPSHVSQFLNPFDPDDWILQPGEYWRQVRHTRSLDPLGNIEMSVFEVIQDHFLQNGTMPFEWFAEGIGEAKAGMKWVVVGQSKLVIQVPHGWREVENIENTRYRDYLSPNKDCLVRVGAMFRPAENALTVPDGFAVGPIRISELAPSIESGWKTCSWQILFSDGVEDMMGLLYFYSQPSAEACASEIRESLAGLLDTSLYVPNDWNMKNVFYPDGRG